MKTWIIYLKSHCEAPDYEDTCEAFTKAEACDIFLQRLNNQAEGGYEKELIWDSIENEDDILGVT